MTSATTIRGSELKVGDVINTWAGKKRIVGLRPYTGPLAYLWPEGARIASFDIGSGMTVANGDLLDKASFQEA
jgi:hypothetical protein